MILINILIIKIEKFESNASMADFSWSVHHSSDITFNKYNLSNICVHHCYGSLAAGFLHLLLDINLYVV